MSTAVMGVSFHDRVMPWAGSPEDDERFRRISWSVVITALLLCLILPWLPVSQPERTQPSAVAAKPVKLVLNDIPPPPPPPVTPPPRVATPVAAATPAPVPPKAKPEPAAAKPQPNVKPAPVQEARNPQPNKPPGEAIDVARRKAAGVGLLAVKDQLAELHDAPVAVQLKPDIKPGPGVGTGTGVGVGAGSEPGLPTRSLITSNAAGGSGGINTAGYSRDTGGGGLAGRATTLVAGVASGGGGGGAARNGKGDGSGTGTGTGTGGGAGGTLQRGGSGKAARSLEDIKLVMERNKGAIYAIYNRALREEPGMQGKVLVELKIAPGGNVIGCRVMSSELHAPELEAKLLARIKQFDFGAKDVDLLVVTWPLDFLPS